jgi:hypothetical protein
MREQPCLLQIRENIADRGRTQAEFLGNILGRNRLGILNVSVYCGSQNRPFPGFTIDCADHIFSFLAFSV